MSEETDEDIYGAAISLLSQHHRTVLKAPLIGLMMFFSATVLSGSAWKGLFIGTVLFLASYFNTWRRYLEPLSLPIFLVSAIFWFDSEIITHTKTAIAIARQ